MLQVAPRGPGTVTASPAGVDEFGQPVTAPCDANEGQNSCAWSYPAGQRVTLTAKADAGASFSGWSSPDCPGTGGCTVTLDEATTVVAMFSPLQLGVKLSTDDNGAVHGRVQSNPAGLNCHQEECKAGFRPNQQVTLTAVPDQGHTFRGWNAGCEPTNQPTCRITVDDNPTWAGARFDDEPAPPLPTTITVRFRVTRGGNGSGKVTASKLSCGSTCSADFDYGKTLTLTATADPGFTFNGWNGVCPATQTTCTFAVGPITSIRALFGRDGTPPSAPASVTAKDVTQTSATIDWAASTDNVRVAGYRVYVDDASAGDTTATELTLQGLACGHEYGVAVDAVDSSGNRSAKTTIRVTTQACPLAARLVAVRAVRAGAARSVDVTLAVGRAARASLALARRGRTVLKRSFALAAGTTTLHLRPSRRLAPGAYRLTIRVFVPGGESRTYTRAVTLPRAR